MARLTKQFLTSAYRIKDYEIEDVSVTVQPMTEDQLAVALESTGRHGRQYLYITVDEAEKLAVELLRCLKDDVQLARALESYFRSGRRTWPKPA